MCCWAPCVAVGGVGGASGAVGPRGGNPPGWEAPRGGAAGGAAAGALPLLCAAAAAAAAAGCVEGGAAGRAVGGGGLGARASQPVRSLLLALAPAGGGASLLPLPLKSPPGLVAGDVAVGGGGGAGAARAAAVEGPDARGGGCGSEYCEEGRCAGCEAGAAWDWEATKGRGCRRVDVTCKRS